jgi:hypothetical protein
VRRLVFLYVASLTALMVAAGCGGQNSPSAPTSVASAATNTTDQGHGAASNERELTGAISNLTGTASGFQFAIGTTTVKGDATTVFDKGTFASLANGVTVEVHGTLLVNVLQASRLHAEDADAPEPQPKPGDGHDPTPPPGPGTPTPPPQSTLRELTGAIAGLTGSAASFQFTIGADLVKGDATTAFDDSTFAALANGVIVEVHGTQQSGFVQVTRLEIKEAGDNEPPNDNDPNRGEERDVKGTVSALAGTCPSIHFTIGGSTANTSASTDFRIGCGSIANGSRIEVRGTQQADGSIAVTRIDADHSGHGG